MAHLKQLITDYEVIAIYKIKSFSSSQRSVIEDSLNQFLETVPAERVKKVSMWSNADSDPQETRTNYMAMVQYLAHESP